MITPCDKISGIETIATTTKIRRMAPLVLMCTSKSHEQKPTERPTATDCDRWHALKAALIFKFLLVACLAHAWHKRYELRSTSRRTQTGPLAYAVRKTPISTSVMRSHLVIEIATVTPFGNTNDY